MEPGDGRSVANGLADTCRGRAAAGLPSKVSPVSRQTMGLVFECRSLKNSGPGFGSSP
jgi:hypothetical protein